MINGRRPRSGSGCWPITVRASGAVTRVVTQTAPAAGEPTGAPVRDAPKSDHWISHRQPQVTLARQFDARDGLVGRPHGEVTAPAECLPVTYFVSSMAYHVQISGQGFSIKSSTRYNLSAEQVQQQFVDPWERGNEIVLGGEVFSPLESQIQVREGPQLSEEEQRNIAAWLLLADRSDDVTDQFIINPPASRNPDVASDDLAEPDPRRVAVVHGRDTSAKDAVFDLLRDLDLRPLEWTELIRATGSGAPHNQTVVQRLFNLAKAVVVLLTPDDKVRLHPEITPAPDHRGDGAWVCQSRPNVFLEAGMALALHPDRTVFVEIGVTRLPSDLEGVNLVRIDGTVPPLHDLARRLEGAGCDVRTEGTAWLRADRFADLSARIRLPTIGSVS